MNHWWIHNYCEIIPLFGPFSTNICSLAQFSFFIFYFDSSLNSFCFFSFLFFFSSSCSVTFLFLQKNLFHHKGLLRSHKITRQVLPMLHLLLVNWFHQPHDHYLWSMKKGAVILADPYHFILFLSSGIFLIHLIQKSFWSYGVSSSELFTLCDRDNMNEILNQHDMKENLSFLTFLCLRKSNFTFFNVSFPKHFLQCFYAICGFLVLCLSMSTNLVKQYFKVPAFDADIWRAVAEGMIVTTGKARLSTLHQCLTCHWTLLTIVYIESHVRDSFSDEQTHYKLAW